MKKKIVLFDIDGTLLDCQYGYNYLTEKTKEALYKLKEAGHYIFIASGRPYCFLLEELIDFHFDGYILDDGAYILFHDKEVAHHPIEVKYLEPMISQAIEKKMTYVAYTKKYAYVVNDDGTLVDYAHTFMINDHYVKYRENIDDIKDQVLKLHVQASNEYDYKHFVIDDQQFFSANDEEHYLYEIYGCKYSKATALYEVLEITGIDKEESYFFGDGYNDIEMMDAVGHGIAMGNAKEEVKSHAEYICKDVRDDGVADFILHSGFFF